MLILTSASRCGSTSITSPIERQGDGVGDLKVFVFAAFGRPGAFVAGFGLGPVGLEQFAGADFGTSGRTFKLLDFVFEFL
jgi:hypothetical protein